MNSFLGRVSGAGFWGRRVAACVCVACFAATEASGQVAGSGAATARPASAIGVTLDTAKLDIVVGEFEAPVIAPVRRSPVQRRAPQTAQSATVTVEEDGSKVAVRVPAGAQSLSEPIHTNGGVRLYLTLPGTSAPVLPDVAGRHGLIGLRLEEGDNAVRLAIDASSLSGYHLETGDGGSTLWLETAPSRRAETTAATTSSTGTGTDALVASTAAPADAVNTRSAGPAAAAITTDGSSAWANNPGINPLVATARDGRATALALAKGFAIGARATGVLAWNGIHAAAGRIASLSKTAATSTVAFSSRSADALAHRLEQAGIDAPQPVIAGALLGLLVATLALWLSLRKRNAARPATAVSEDTTDKAAQTTTARPRAPRVAAASSPAVGNGSPAIWAARTMAGNGLDAASIARRTGIARDAAVLLVAGARRNVPDPAASSPSLLAAVTAGPIPVEALI